LRKKSHGPTFVGDLKAPNLLASKDISMAFIIELWSNPTSVGIFLDVN